MSLVSRRKNKVTESKIPSAESVGFRLQVIRNFYGLSQRELAKRAGVPNSAISVIEHEGVSPTVSSLEKILRAFPMTMQEFFSTALTSLDPVWRQDEDVQPLGSAAIGKVISADLISPQGGHRMQYCKGGAGYKTEPTRQPRSSMLCVLDGRLRIYTTVECRELVFADTMSLPENLLYRLEVKGASSTWLILPARAGR